ncbi:hypothetical protein CHS0354_026697 [Potamilus streckersoni]|uniref:Uncharacterized protein n=1 Tax=Potamilus streckersoni TaxID=2493646 RepID=A0AAE0VR69_9BIVA|nr:hypothetical protein CHS0354_026697 [Potamilus streckersoni]
MAFQGKDQERQVIQLNMRKISLYNIYQALLYGTKQLMTNSREVNTDGTCTDSFARKDGLLRDWWNGCLSVCKISLLLENLKKYNFITCLYKGVN